MNLKTDSFVEIVWTAAQTVGRGPTKHDRIWHSVCTLLL